MLLRIPTAFDTCPGNGQVILSMRRSTDVAGKTPDRWAGRKAGEMAESLGRLANCMRRGYPIRDANFG